MVYVLRLVCIQLQVLGTIVPSFAIDVMDYLLFKEGPSQFLFHYHS
jgi:hypothetical protein